MTLTLKDKNCKHLNTTVNGHNLINHGSCPDCNREINLCEVLNNWLQELREIKNELQSSKSESGTQ